MQSNFEAKNIKNAKEALSQDLNMATRHLNTYKERQKELRNELLKELSLGQKITTFLKNIFKVW